MKKIIIINGSGGGGKDSFVFFCQKYTNCKNISTVDKVKEAYELLGWDGEKTEEHRLNLSNMKDMSTKMFDHPYKYISKMINLFIENQYDEILFIHSREPDEITRFVKDFGCITLLVKNPNVKKIESNHADAEVENYDYNYTILNDGTLQDLEITAKNFIEYLRG